MKNLFTKFIFLFFVVNVSHSQAWLTNLDIAQKLALVQNKMVLMVWEDATEYDYQVVVNNENGNIVFVQNLFENEEVSPLIWKYFIPVIVDELEYEDLYMNIKDKRSQKYIDKFNDDSIKIMDINGHILNVSNQPEGYQNITKIILDYGLNTEFIATELKGYNTNPDFYSAYYLASKYLDYSLYTKESIRENILDLATIYLDTAAEYLVNNPEENQSNLLQRVALSKIEQYLILKRPRKVLRELKRIDTETIAQNNQGFVDFLYYTSYRVLGDIEEAELWKSNISSLDLKKAQLLINLND
ncbi:MULTISPECIES: hypothetical protein [Winogradskyella]|uniref:hypothetical protein n=1 Tax=Winogradskyella TaxID=286104 RepID=UPI0015C94B45|nr:MULTISPECIES: hypothetical protein [Winogradskyella]QXP79726.1 hypothetical protein H0I32_03545 [Winogradskyella sp. HaHa_3_26]